MYLDCDTTPPLRSHKLLLKPTPGGVESAVRAALLYIEEAKEGQIGIYDDHASLNFHGYVIKYPGQRAVFRTGH